MVKYSIIVTLTFLLRTIKKIQTLLFLYLHLINLFTDQFITYKINNYCESNYISGTHENDM